MWPALVVVGIGFLAKKIFNQNATKPTSDSIESECDIPLDPKEFNTNLSLICNLGYSIHAAAEVVQLTAVNQFSGKSQEEVAAIRVQTAFRGYLDGFPEKEFNQAEMETYQFSGVLPSELEGQIVELESELRQTHSKLHEKEAELQALKDCVRYLTECSLGNAAHAAAEVVRLTTVNQFSGKSQEEVAAIRVQTAFRGYLARRAFRGLVRLKSLVDGPTAKRQTANALKCMQTLSRVQSQISSRRIRMLEENQRQLMQKHAKELESSRRGEKWDDSLQSKEQIEASLLRKYEAATRRERALAYSYYHQQTWKKSSRSTNLLFLDPTNPQWTGARPWESQSMSEKGLKTDQMCVRSVSIAGGEIAKSFARHQLNSELPSSPSSQKSSHPSGYNSPTTPSKSATSVAAARKLKPASPRVNAMNQDEDSRSMQLEQNRRHSIASSPSVPSYMASAQSAKAKTRLQSPLDMGNGTPEKGSAGPVKKRLSYHARPRRHSGPSKFDNTSITEDHVNGVVN